MKGLWTLLIMPLCATGLQAQDSAAVLWQRIAPFFTPPSQYASDFGSLRNVLRFNDGTLAQTPEDWQVRREEILGDWNGRMGAWPDLIESPVPESIASVQIENFSRIQLKIRLAPSPFPAFDAYLMVPDGIGPFPAVVVVYYEPGTPAGLNNASNPNRDFALQMARRGFVSLALGRQYYQCYYPDSVNAALQPSSFHAYAAANAWRFLAGRPDIDSTAIGIIGHSYGGKWAMFGSCLWDRYAAAAWSDPGVLFDESSAGNANYWESWYLGWERGMPMPMWTTPPPRYGAYKQLYENGHNLHELMALMAPRPFLLSGGAIDSLSHWRALNHARAVDSLLGFGNRVAMTTRAAHAPTTESNLVLCDFMEFFLRYGGIVDTGNTRSEPLSTAKAGKTGPWSLFDIRGRMVRRFQGCLSVEGLKPGVYLMRALNGKTRKLVILE